ncbi:PqqD family protein [bacterium]|nr:PqqD family protein [bacterium]
MDTLPVPVDQVVEQELSEGLLLLRDTGDYVIVNSTGRMVWKHLRESRNLDVLLDTLASRESAPDREQCRAEVVTFCRELVSVGFLRESQ